MNAYSMITKLLVNMRCKSDSNHVMMVVQIANMGADFPSARPKES